MRINNFLEENYTQERVTLSIARVYVFVFMVFFAAILLFGLPFYFMWPGEIQKVIDIIKNNYSMGLQERLLMTIKSFAVCLAIVLPLIAIHELIHGLFYSIFSVDGFKSLKFGFALKHTIAYCDCTEVLRMNHFKISVIVPPILMGIIPTVISLFIGNWILLFWGIVFIAAGAVDLLGFLKLLREKNDSWFIFHTAEMAGTIYRPIY